MTEAITLSLNSWYGLDQETSSSSQGTTTTSSTSFSDSLVSQLSNSQDSSDSTSSQSSSSASTASSTPTDNYYGYLLGEWQVMHPEATQLLSDNAGFSDFLDANSDYADMFTNAGGEGIEKALNAFQSQSSSSTSETTETTEATTGTSESGAPTDNSYAFTLDDWQAAHPGAMALFGDMPGLAEFLANNPSYGSEFVNGGILGSSNAVSAYLAQYSDSSSTVSTTA